MPKLIVGLGNPGIHYKYTKHNLGFIVLDLIIDNLCVNWIKKNKSLVAEIFNRNEKVLLLKPQTFMNYSGEAVNDIMNFYKIKSQDVLIIYDDLDLPLGKIKIRSHGSSGGHNGLKSIISHIGDQFPRLKIGIGKAPLEWNTSNWVLSRFNKEEWKKLQPTLKLSTEIAFFWLENDIQKNMHKFNKN